MPPRRITDVRLDATLVVDGEEVRAREGEPVAVALAAAGRLVLCRSVKYHRPRGAACYAGRCDGCLMRVDGAPSQMTCRVPARDGMRVETQNVVGSASIDLLALTDWFFPGGMNHHEMFTWSRPVNQVMQSVARQVAGIGTLPDEVAPPVAIEAIEVDALVIGAGASGLAAASQLARGGARTLVVDEEPRLGGLAAAHGAPERAASAIAAAREAGADLRTRASAIGAYEADAAGCVVAVSTPERLLRVRARRVLIATGRHEGATDFEGNDLPGVIGSDAALRLIGWGVSPGERIVVAGSVPAAARVAGALAALGVEVVGPVSLASIRRARGGNEIESVELTTGVRERCDALVVAPPTSAAFELAGQLGAEVVYRGGTFEISVGRAGATASPCARVIGSAAGANGSTEDTHAACDAVLMEVS